MNYRRFVSLWGPVLAYMGTIFFFSSLHQPPLPPGLGDKPAHGAGYIGFGLVIARALAGGLPPRITLRQALVGFALAACYAVSDEYHQSFVEGRSADVLDWYSDVAGSAIALCACWAWGILRRQEAGGRSQ